MIFLFGFEGGRTCFINWVKQSAIFTSLGPGSALGEKGEKRSAWAKKEIGERSEPRGSLDLGREKGDGSWKHALDGFSSSLRSH